MLSSFTPGIPDKNQIDRQLSALGYKKGDTVYLRAFLPANHPNKQNDKGRKDSFNNSSELTKTVTKWQQQGLGIYLVINGGGHTDSEVTSCRAIFYEHDNLDKELQINLWQSLNLPTPTFQIDTGGKSIHSYWVFAQPVQSDKWRILQTDLLDYADADRSLKNPSRVMRLAGCLHASGQQSKIISDSGQTYTFSELRNVIPRKIAATTTPVLPLLLTDDVPLYQCLSKDDRILIDSGQAQGGRNSAGAKLARNLIGTAARLTHLGHRYSGDARLLFDGYCSNCSPPIDTREADSIWKSAQKDNPTATLSDDALENCIKAWQRQQHPETHNRVSIKASEKSSQNPLISTVQALIDKDLRKFELEALLPEVAEQTGRNSNDIRRVYFALKKEHENTEERQEASKQIPKLLEAQQARIDPFSIFWGDGGKFAQVLTDVALSMPTSPENLITTLIPAVGSRMGTAARIIINPASNYTQPAIFWSCVVAPTGRLKTPAQEVIISPLMQLEAEQYQWAEALKEEYESDLKIYKKNSSDTEPPIKPPPRKRFIVGGATAETRIKIHTENPRGLLNYRDEWSSFINGRNKYRNGKGDDLELDLSEFNGAGIFKDTTSDNLFIERSAISRTGNTQPETLQKFLAQQDFEDYTGEFARWLFCLVPGDIAYIDLFKGHDDAGSLLQAMLTNLYLQVDRLPKKDYFLTDDAKRIFQEYHRRLTDAEIEENHPGLRATYPKLKSYLARLALWLHIVNAALAHCEPESMISVQTMHVACQLTSFYLAQAQILYKGSNHQITGNLLKIKEYIEKRDGVTAREIKAGVFSLRQTPTSEVLSSCMCLKEQGLVFFDGKKFYSCAKNINTLSKSLATQAVEGVDLGSTKINTFEKFQVQNLATQAVEGVDLRSTVDQHRINTSSTVLEKDKTVDLVDQQLIQDQQKDQHLQTQSGQELQVFTVDEVLISDQHPQHQSGQGFQHSKCDFVDQIPKIDISECQNSDIALRKSVEVVENSDRTLVTVEGKLGKSTVIIAVKRRFKRYIEVVANYVFADGSTDLQQFHPEDLAEAEAIAKLQIQAWESAKLPNDSPTSYRVRQLGDEGFIWVEDCQLVEIPKPPFMNFYVFTSPAGDSLRVRGADDFEIMQVKGNESKS
ncbi:hypothetical protein VF14_11530 [Nostoc linckia z18]|uniref:DUF3987 domain-containing protein n=2 Tax=Nostoc linckia TaxID=92942 RepID=A0A9Q5ZA22_NOSLI|nr:DUF3987 domain-containing protein [Nostoc linckia]PHK40914.1 hypothetical protein VF12_08720 [Nostoc linckia z15]PHK46457.1 hypothetical protein VF13_10955 [Nostoc linckia z16]PHJ60257.1 hypothetical protein VF02_23110 [Nostoc linckia z1]PHJ63823.1 hypothetical protein VF05_24075 [Nostoc linckia z3]PHJ70837.1 hypothetical protein VF03_21645 [Nostoc linckia z2]